MRREGPTSTVTTAITFTTTTTTIIIITTTTTTTNIITTTTATIIIITTVFVIDIKITKSGNTEFLNMSLGDFTFHPHGPRSMPPEIPRPSLPQLAPALRNKQYGAT
ncbi:hypothetical protein PoB_005979900 [Plakobranchus ocellatus]|uniref:Uncharacterized protein n=1 Tax=Plakobranchus ocellatus TaxID=259542 RepID=A0AAV4CNB5_9GAST|nr:hypothetical protein PoB_005979900 [Plakobranchus ocellatus]